MSRRIPLDVRLLAHRRIVRHGRWKCWEYDGYLMPNGYAQIRPPGERRLVYVHRAAYELWVGPIPDGHDVHHRCEVRNCFNPGHLVPRAASSHKREHGRRAVCRRGHPLVGPGADVYRHRGKAKCRACRRERRAQGAA